MGNIWCNWRDTRMPAGVLCSSWTGQRCIISLYYHLLNMTLARHLRDGDLQFMLAVLRSSTAHLRRFVVSQPILSATVLTATSFALLQPQLATGSLFSSHRSVLSMSDSDRPAYKPDSEWKQQLSAQEYNVRIISATSLDHSLIFVLHC